MGEANDTRDDEAMAAFEAAWDELFRAIRRMRSRVAAAPAGELTLPQLQLLSPLLEARELHVGELAQAAGVATPTATRMLDGLVRDGLAERRRCDDDRRNVTVALTDKGRRVVEEKARRLAEKKREIFATLTPEERRLGAQILKRLARGFDEL